MAKQIFEAVGTSFCMGYTPLDAYITCKVVFGSLPSILLYILKLTAVEFHAGFPYAEVEHSCIHVVFDLTIVQQLSDLQILSVVHPHSDQQAPENKHKPCYKCHQSTQIHQ